MSSNVGSVGLVEMVESIAGFMVSLWSPGDKEGEIQCLE